jgi:hypothetical protein
MKCANVRPQAAAIFIIPTKETEKGRFKKELSLKICRMIGNALYAVRGRKGSNLWDK